MNLEKDFEIARLHFTQCNFEKASSELSTLAESFFRLKDFVNFLKCKNLLLVIYEETEKIDLIVATKEHLQDLVLKEGFELNSKTFYTLGICSRMKGQNEAALEYFQKALAHSLTNDNKEDMCHAIAGLASVYHQIGFDSEALKEVNNLKVFFEVLRIPELVAATQILTGNILNKLGQPKQAIEILLAGFESLKSGSHGYLYLRLIYSLGSAYLSSGEADLSRFYLQLAKRSIDPKNLSALSKKVDKKLLQLGVKPSQDYDLIFDFIHKSVTEKNKGKVDFNNQFILLELLHLLVKSPGKAFSKEQLTQKIWSENYNPSTHDNKIYVTIKRLRQMIEPDYEKPKYIFRAKDGYYLNKDIRVLVEH